MNFGLASGSRPAAEVLQDYYVIRILPLLAAIVVGESGATVTVYVCVFACVRVIVGKQRTRVCMCVCLLVCANK